MAQKKKSVAKKKAKKPSKSAAPASPKEALWAALNAKYWSPEGYSNVSESDEAVHARLADGTSVSAVFEDGKIAVY